MKQRHVFMDDETWERIRAWGQEQQPPLNTSAALRALVWRALRWETLKKPGAYLEAWRKLKEEEKE
jgi:hypothetical protein